MADTRIVTSAQHLREAVRFPAGVKTSIGTASRSPGLETSTSDCQCTTHGIARAEGKRSIVIEALVMGVFASVVGLFLGLALAKGLFSLFDAVGFTLPNEGLTFETRTIVVALALISVGFLVRGAAPSRRRMRSLLVPTFTFVLAGSFAIDSIWSIVSGSPFMRPPLNSSTSFARRNCDSAFAASDAGGRSRKGSAVVSNNVCSLSTPPSREVG